ncbi:unnamed protein product [Cuscuta europaea]|uniref:Protein TIC 214 n=1 Tax=Cuscuta europaea TaxID=41803 RepID=A0A9P1EPL9_CUSEU|nr:unnamed protein product [Cuscuta europaea]
MRIPPLFFDRMRKKTFFSLPYLAQLKRLFRKWSSIKEFGILESTEEKKIIIKEKPKRKKKRREEIERLEIGEAWGDFSIYPNNKRFFINNPINSQKKDSITFIHNR